MNEAASLNIRVQRWVVVIALLLFFVKVIAWLLTHSVAVLTDALESTVNIVTAFIGLYSLRIAALPRDENHPYGHGKAELLSASFEGILILVAGLIIIYQSLINLHHPQLLHQLDVGILLVGGTAVVNYVMGWYCLRVGRQNHSIALMASGKHLHSDTLSTAGIVVGLLLIRLTGRLWLDGAVAIFFGGYIILEGYRIIRRTVAGIMDEADEELLRQVIAVLNAYKRPTWMDVHNLRIIKYGSVLHLDCHLTVPWYFNVNEGHAEVEALNALIVRHFPQSLEMFVHMDGCAPPMSCRICPLAECTVRQAAFDQRLEWTFENLTSDRKHGLPPLQQ